MSTAGHVTRWSLHLLQPWEVEHELILPDFASSSEPTRAALDFIENLAALHLPAWYHHLAISIAVVLTLYLAVGWSIFFWRIYNKTFWLCRWQEGRIVPNGVNCFGTLGGVCLLIWLGYIRVMFRGSCVPALVSLFVSVLWLAGWTAGYGSLFCIPSATPFGRVSYSAWQSNAFFLGVPALLCAQNAVLGALAQLKYSKALASAYAYEQLYASQDGNMPVSAEQLKGAIQVWAKFVSAWSYASALYFALGLWALAAGCFYAVVLVRLMTELKRQKREHTFGNSAAGARVNPVWSEAARSEATSPGVAVMESLLISSRAASFHLQVEIGTPHFFPPFNPAPSTFTDATEVMFRKCMHNLCASGLLGLTIFTSVTALCWFISIAAPSALRDSDRRRFTTVYLIDLLCISFALVIVGIFVVGEVVFQSLQPVLGTWVFAPKVERSEKPNPQSHAPRRTQRRSIFRLLSRLPKATGNQLERASASFFEARSHPGRQRLYSLPEAPEALVSLGEAEEGEVSSDVHHSSADAARCRMPSSVSANPRAVYGLDPRQQDSQRFSTSLTDGAVHGSRETYTVEARVASSDEAQELRIWPAPTMPTRVHFTRSTQITYETIATPARTASRRPERPFTPSWRGTANNVPSRS